MKSTPFRTGWARMSARLWASRQTGPSSTIDGIKTLLLARSRRGEHVLAKSPSGTLAVDDQYSQLRFHGFDLDRFHLNHAVQPTLERALHKELRRSGKRITVGHEHKLFDAAPKIGTIHTFAWVGE